MTKAYKNLAGICHNGLVIMLLFVNSLTSAAPEQTTETSKVLLPQKSKLSTPAPTPTIQATTTIEGWCLVAITNPNITKTLTRGRIDDDLLP